MGATNCFLCSKTLGFFSTPANGKGITKDGYSVCLSCHVKISRNNGDVAKRMKDFTKDEVIDTLNEALQQKEMQVKERKERKDLSRQKSKEAFEKKYAAWQENKEVQKRKVEDLKEVIKKINPTISTSLYPEIKELIGLLMIDETIEKVESGYLEYIDKKKENTGKGLIVATNYRLIFIYKPLIGFGVKMEDYAYNKITTISLDTGFLKSKIKVTCSGNTALINLLSGAKELSEFVRQKTLQKPIVSHAQKNPNTGNGILEQIEKLSSMKEKGILTIEEFETQKQKLLEKL